MAVTEKDALAPDTALTGLDCTEILTGVGVEELPPPHAVTATKAKNITKSLTTVEILTSLIASTCILLSGYGLLSILTGERRDMSICRSLRKPKDLSHQC